MNHAGSEQRQERESRERWICSLLVTLRLPHTLSRGVLGKPLTCSPHLLLLLYSSSSTSPEPIDTEPQTLPVNAPRSSWTVMRRGSPVPHRAHRRRPWLGMVFPPVPFFCFFPVVFITTEPDSSSSFLSLVCVVFVLIRFTVKHELQMEGNVSQAGFCSFLERVKFPRQRL